MTTEKIAALVNYMEFNLMSFVAVHERSVSPEVAQQMYADAYAMLIDIESALTVDETITRLTTFPANKK